MTTLESLPVVLRVSDVARVLDCGRNQAYALVASGAISSVRVGRAIRVPRQALLTFLGISYAQGEATGSVSPDALPAR